MITINVNNKPFLTLDVPKELLEKKRRKIKNIIIPYLYQIETAEIKLEIKNKILKLFIKDLRKQKLEKIDASRIY